MKSVLLILLSTFAWGLPDGPRADDPVVGTMKVFIDNVRAAEGTIWIGVYTSDEDFLDREQARLVSLKVNTAGRAYVEIPDMVVGEDYALGLFHDVNDNGEFDLNWLGLPAEPWAFSGTPKTRLRLPYFNEVSFYFQQPDEVRAIRLRKW